MLDIADYALSTTVNPVAVVAIWALAFAAGYKEWGPGARPAQPGGVPPAFIRKTAPKGRIQRLIEKTIMLILSLGAVTLGVATGPKLYAELWGHFSRLGENDTLFTLGLFGCSVALTFFAVREFYRLLRP